MNEPSPREVAVIRPLQLPPHPVLDLPGSKSHANRLLVLAALLPGERSIRHATPCDDVVAMVDNLARLGFDIGWSDRAAGIVHARGGRPIAARAALRLGEPAAPIELDCGLAGTTQRFLLAVAATVPGRWLVTGAKRLRARPITPLVEALRGLGVKFEGEVVVGGSGAFAELSPGARRCASPLRTELDASLSSQYLSALLLVAASFADGALEVRLRGELASAGYLETTRHALRAFGKDVVVDPITRVYCVRAHAGSEPHRAAAVLEVDADRSAAAFWWCLAELTGGGFDAARLDLGPDETQPDSRVPQVLRELRGAGERIVDIRVVPDQLMNLAVVAARRAGRTVFVGAANLRHKESDRLAVLAQAFADVGIAARCESDRFIVDGPTPRLRPAELDPCDDHRMVMAFHLLGLLREGIRVRDPSCVHKSYPGFFADVERARSTSRCIALIGMRGAGKSTLARALGERLGLEVHDTDSLIERAAGRSIAALVRDEGWPGFRAREAAAVAQALRPGRVVALGGGAIETPAVRDLLAANSFVVWIDESVETCAARIAATAGDSRPSLTGGDKLAELGEIAAARRPRYAELARLRLPPGQTLLRRIETCLDGLRAAVRW